VANSMPERISEQKYQVKQRAI